MTERRHSEARWALLPVDQRQRNHASFPLYERTIRRYAACQPQRHIILACVEHASAVR